MSWHLVGIILMGVGLPLMWGCLFVGAYLQGSLDTLKWSLAMLEWEHNGNPWAAKPEHVIRWRELALQTGAAIGITTVAILVLIGGK